MQKALVIGGGFAGMTAASFLAKDGFAVELIEKNAELGGRNRNFSVDGFTFDMGPSWYWMPDVFEKFYNQFGYTTTELYKLKRLNPSYRIFWPEGDSVDLPVNREDIIKLFDQIEKGSGKGLDRFLNEAGIKYRAAMDEFVYKPSLSFNEYMNATLIKQSFKLDLFTSVSKHIRKFISHPRLLQILEFPVLFLGAKPQFTPALFSIMNYADMELGTWYPEGGMYEITKAFKKILDDVGVQIYLNEEVKEIRIEKKIVNEVITHEKAYHPDILVSGADYHHTEQILLKKEFRSYSNKYWEKKVMAPSCLLFYLGINKKVPGLLHHNLFFDTSFTLHAEEIYDTHRWPTDPLFYVSCTSKTEATAPSKCENLFILIPISTRIEDSPALHQTYLDKVLHRIEKHTGEKIKDSIIFNRSYCINDFKKDYHAFRGNAYGLANTLLQTGPLRPKIKSKKVKNLYFTGQLTVPGPGMPPAIISGEVVSKFIVNEQNSNV